MSFRKISASKIFNGYQFLDADWVLVLNSDGKIEATIPKQDAGADIELYEGILSPGFINCHCHLELSHLKDVIPHHTGLPAFLSNVMNLRAFPREKILAAMQRGDKTMQENGIIAVGDICNTDISIEVKKNSTLYYYNFVETMGLLSEKTKIRFEQASKLFDTFQAIQQANMIGTAIVPHAPYSLTPALWQLITAFDKNQLLSIHSQESGAEEELIRQGKGELLDFYKKIGVPVSPLAGRYPRSLLATCSFLNLSIPVILVHNVETNKADVDEILNKRANEDLFWCLCPNANLYISQKLPNITMLKEAKLQLVLGTDSLASNSELSILSEIKTIRAHFPEIGMDEIFRWATINGAKALQIDHRLGSFEPGKTPGVVLMDESFTHIRRLQ